MNINTTPLIIFLCTLILSACTQNPAHVENYGEEFYGEKSGKKSSKYLVQKKRQSKVYRSVIVKKGWSLYEVAGWYDIPAREIIELNHLTPPYFLVEGQKLNLPKPLVHIVKAGDTLYGISRHYGVDMSRIVKVNKLQKPYELDNGQEIRLPYQSYKVEKAPQITLPKKKPSNVIKKTKNSHARVVQKVKTSHPKKYVSSKKTGRKFIWPVSGKIVSSFGAKKGGIYNDGINIAAKKGSNVRASASGEVAYTGNRLKGYGNMLIIKHNGGLFTAYAHNSKMKVKRGDKVKRGEVIATVGSSGGVKIPQLYFAIRKGHTALNPEKILSR